MQRNKNQKGGNGMGAPAEKLESAKFERVKHEWLYINELRPHPKVQRNIRPGWVNEIADRFDPDKFGELNVIKSGHRYLVFNGQHRLQAARQVYGDKQKVPCAVYDDIPVERQAELFLGLNSTRAVRAIDKWKVRIVAKEEPVITIEKILAEHDLCTSDASGEGTVQAVTALEKVYGNYGEDVFRRTIQLLEDTWGHDEYTFDGTLLKAIGLLVNKFDGQVDVADLTRKLARSGGPGRLLGQARDYAKVSGMAVPRAMCEKIVNIYNKGRRMKQLEM